MRAEQPYSSISNAAFVSAGIAIISANGLLGATLVFLGIGSFCYHALPKSAFPSWGERLDEVGMYAVLIAMLGIQVEAYLPGVAIHLAIWGIFTAAWLHDRLDSFQVVGVLSSAALVLVGLQHGWWLALGFTLWMVASAALRALGEYFAHEIMHPLWHLSLGLLIYSWSGYYL